MSDEDTERRRVTVDEIDAPSPRPDRSEMHRLNDGWWYYRDANGVLWTHPSMRAEVHRLNDGWWYYRDANGVLWTHPSICAGSTSLWERAK